MVAVTLLILILFAFLFPFAVLHLVRRSLLIATLALGLAAIAGHATGRFAVSALTRDADDREARLRLFLSDTGHELRTPLTVMRGSLGVLRRAVPANDIAAAAILDGLEQEVERLTAIVGQLLLLARLDVIRPAPVVAVDVGGTLAELIDEARTIDPAADIAITAPAALSVAIDPTAFREAIRNLIDNARRHAPGAAIRIHARVEGNDTVIRVEDDGPGLDAEDCALIFERYYRGAQAAATPGTGLGLAIVRATAERFGGGADAESGAGRGLAITIRLPASLSVSRN